MSFIRLRAAAAILVWASTAYAQPRPSPEPPGIETIVMIRHGEKPPGGLGQLTCQGENRALALPAVLKEKFGKPQAIFAPNPADTKKDRAGTFDYIRPLATIEPSAIAFGMAVDTTYGYDDVAGLKAALTAPRFQNSVVIVAWEHHKIVALAATFLPGGQSGVPAWKEDDYDGIYVIRLVSRSGKVTADFQRSSEGLNGLPETCPAPTVRG
jgi:hypothetical protein